MFSRNCNGPIQRSASIEMQNGGTPLGYLVKQTIYVICNGSCGNGIYGKLSFAALSNAKVFTSSTLVVGFTCHCFGFSRAVNGAKGWISYRLL